jgi:uncharacterized protein YdaU (DUF1376 family)
MRKARNLVVALAAVSMFFVLTGCHNKPNEEELAAMEELKAKALAAEKAEKDCGSEKANLESQLADAQQQLADAQEEQKLVSKRLAEME